jgi:hypothetical protein
MVFLSWREARTDLPPSFSGFGSAIGSRSWPRLKSDALRVAIVGTVTTAFLRNARRFTGSSFGNDYIDVIPSMSRKV